VPSDYLKLLLAVLLFGLVIILIPYFKIKSVLKKNRNESKAIVLPLLIIISIGIGFMILEISLFQKFILYLGSSTISLSILLGSLLVGMGVGSYFGNKIYSNNHIKRLRIISLLIFGAGVIAFILYPIILNWLLAYSQILRSVVSFILLLPLGFLLGIPFPSCLQILKQNNLEKYIPWMYGINGIMSVAGSILAITLSMIFGFTPAFFIGLCFYLAVFVITYNR
jgi:predicted membrane-bound spermidine synthase